MSTVLNEPISCTGCGRTDTGVHSKEFYAHFDTAQAKIDNNILFKLNSCLPYDIAVHKIFKVPNDAHARFDAVSRSYTYYINRKKAPFLKEYSHNLYIDLDIKKMQSAADLLLNFKDFSCFSKSGSQVKTKECHITAAKWEKLSDQLIFTITADRFLRGMVRAVVGTLIEIGKGKMSLLQFRKIIRSGDRRKAGPAVPACGLFLTGVEYPVRKLNKPATHCVIYGISFWKGV